MKKISHLIKGEGQSDWTRAINNWLLQLKFSDCQTDGDMVKYTLLLAPGIELILWNPLNYENRGSWKILFNGENLMDNDHFDKIYLEIFPKHDVPFNLWFGVVLSILSFFGINKLIVASVPVPNGILIPTYVPVRNNSSVEWTKLKIESVINPTIMERNLKVTRLLSNMFRMYKIFDDNFIKECEKMICFKYNQKIEFYQHGRTKIIVRTGNFSNYLDYDHSFSIQQFAKSQNDTVCPYLFYKSPPFMETMCFIDWLYLTCREAKEDPLKERKKEKFI